jgi:hypothetical protein
MRRGTWPLLLLIAGAALFVDLFLPWAKSAGRVSATGWEISLVNYSGLVAVALVLVELTRMYGGWDTVGSSRAGLLLAGAAAILVVGGIIHLHWGDYARLRFSGYAYGAWIGLGIGIVLAAGSWLRLAEHRGGPAA